MSKIFYPHQQNLRLVQFLLFLIIREHFLDEAASVFVAMDHANPLIFQSMVRDGLATVDLKSRRLFGNRRVCKTNGKWPERTEQKFEFVSSQSASDFGPQKFQLRIITGKQCQRRVTSRWWNSNYSKLRFDSFHFKDNVRSSFVYRE